MKNFDLVEKINVSDLIGAILTRQIVEPHDLLKKAIVDTKKLTANYFNWGRNALYFLFKSLPYKKLTFPAFTCPTITQAAEKAGKKVILTEIDINTFNININKIAKDTKCLVVVHTFGNPANIQVLKEKFPNMYIIEDCAHALFAKYENKYIGNKGDVVLISLYKQFANINGALILTKDRLLKNQDKESNIEYLKRLIFKTKGWHQYLLNRKRHDYLPQIEPHGISKKKPSSLVFKLFQNKFTTLEKEITERRKVAKWYDEFVLKSLYFTNQKINRQSLSSYYHYVVRFKPEYAWIRDELGFNLRQKNIFLGRLWYDAPITKDKYARFKKNCPNAELLSKSVLNLPISGNFSKEDVENLFISINHEINKIVK